MSAGPASHRATNELVLSLLRDGGKLEGDILDMGAGGGYLTRLLAQARSRKSDGLFACDIDGTKFSADAFPSSNAMWMKACPMATRRSMRWLPLR